MVQSQSPPVPFRIDADMQHSSADQWVVGLDHELPGNIGLTARGISRRFSAFMGLVDEGSAYTPVERIDPGPDTNPDDAYNRYDAFQVAGRRRFIGWWQMQASCTLVPLPWLGGANVSSVYRYTTGQAWGRRARFFSLPQGQETMRIEPQGTRRLDAINRLDLRAEKTFPLGGARRTLGNFLEGSTSPTRPSPTPTSPRR